MKVGRRRSEWVGIRRYLRAFPGHGRAVPGPGWTAPRYEMRLPRPHAAAHGAPLRAAGLRLHAVARALVGMRGTGMWGAGIRGPG